MRGADDGRDVIAAAWTPRPGCITLGQARALLAAAQWAGMSAADLAATVRGVAEVDHVDLLTPDGFADVMDCFVAGGFRHPLVPMVTPVQLATLDEMRRFLGLDGRAFVDLVRQLGGVRTRRHLDGAGFIAVWGWLARHGGDVPVPGHGTMTRAQVRLIHEAAHDHLMSGPAFLDRLVRVGGVLRASDLDRRGYRRLLISLTEPGVQVTAPAPRVPGDPGMVTQAQANLLWRLWRDFGGWKRDTSPAALDAAIGSMLGMGSGLATLTRAGARTVIDRFMVPRLSARRMAEGGERPPPAAATAALSKRGKRRHGGRR